MNLLNNNFIKQRKLLITLTVIVGFILVLVTLQMNITKVSAQIVPILVHEEHLDFGTVFPGEELQGDFTVYYVEEYEQEGITYRIIKKRKPLPEGHPELPNGGDPEMPGFYRNLCSFLTPVNIEGEGDTISSAFVGSDDLSDVWTIHFKVPAIIGHISQDHIGGVVTSNGEYGCDISIDVDIEP